MSKVRFPKKRTDDSFCVEVTLSVVTDDPKGLLHQIQDWAVQWVKVNQIWMWKSDTGSGRELHYKQEFKREPYPVSCTSTELKICLEGQPTAKWWKDWFVYRILPDLKTTFVEIKDFDGIKDCD